MNKNVKAYDTAQGEFTQTPNFFLKLPNLSAEAKIIFLIFYGSGPNYTLSLEIECLKLGFGERIRKRVSHELEECGFLIRVNRGQGRSGKWNHFYYLSAYGDLTRDYVEDCERNLNGQEPDLMPETHPVVPTQEQSQRVPVVDEQTETAPVHNAEFPDEEPFDFETHGWMLFEAAMQRLNMYGTLSERSTIRTKMVENFKSKRQMFKNDADVVIWTQNRYNDLAPHLIKELKSQVRQ